MCLKAAKNISYYQNNIIRLKMDNEVARDQPEGILQLIDKIEKIVDSLIQEE